MSTFSFRPKSPRRTAVDINSGGNIDAPNLCGTDRTHCQLSVDIRISAGHAVCDEKSSIPPKPLWRNSVSRRTAAVTTTALEKKIPHVTAHTMPVCSPYLVVYLVNPTRHMVYCVTVDYQVTSFQLEILNRLSTSFAIAAIRYCYSAMISVQRFFFVQGNTPRKDIYSTY